ncbi:exosortase/archaeosortase family protein [Dietzia aurantiaca]|uniref:exosortase/archaeosortase family protein n=1 Tax=Dietzia aurantiaca TaxID=983873 RepID=UPI001E5CC3B8|nr:exosortase/archaeosortase family protein [Dietzia aurantiaca]MCD2263607.1 exosortase/archaeosortase family protein [Dietzia aurantiaca]
MTPRTSAVAESTARGVLLLTLVVLAFWSTWGRVADETAVGAGSAVVLAPPLGGLLTVSALAWRRRPELPIHDRQSDAIVGTVVLLIALMSQWLLVPRYAGAYVLLHVDVMAAWAYLLGCCIFAFGLRRTGRFWATWLVLAVASPGAMRLVMYLLGGGPWAEAAVVATVVFAGPVVVIVRGVRRGRPSARVQWAGPAVTARQAWRSVPLLLVVGVALWLAPLPGGAETRLGHGPSGPAGPGQNVPAGWTERSVQDFQWAPRMFGPSATLYRQLLRADAPRADWDQLMRPRQAVVQTLTVSDPGQLDVYPLEMTYDLTNARVGDPEPVDLGHGITGRYRTVVDDDRLLTWSLLTFTWTRSSDHVQRVSVLTVDDHEYDAEFPETVHVAGSTFGRMLSLLLRGSASVTASGPQDKDLAMLTELGTNLVEAQWQTQ